MPTARKSTKTDNSLFSDEYLAVCIGTMPPCGGNGSKYFSIFVPFILFAIRNSQFAIRNSQFVWLVSLVLAL